MNEASRIKKLCVRCAGRVTRQKTGRRRARSKVWQKTGRRRARRKVWQKTEAAGGVRVVVWGEEAE